MRKKIKGFSHYSIDEKGIVINDLTNKIKTPTSNLTGKGYLYIDLWESGKKYRKYIHRLLRRLLSGVYKLFRKVKLIL